VSDLRLPALAPPGLSVRAHHDDDRLYAAFDGAADMSSIDGLDAYLAALHEEARAHGVQSVTIDFRDLEFMNSSCFKCFVSWLGTIQDLPEASRYQIVFLSNRQLHWQRRSLNALRCFAADVVTIQA
jgi:hypothetical protein